MSFTPETAGASPILKPESDVEKVQGQLSNVKNEEFRRPFSNFTWYLSCVGLYLGALLYGLDTTIAADVQGPIIESFGEIQKLAWVGIGFPMGSVCLILLIGNIYGLLNLKPLLISSIIIFEAGSALCGAAPSMNALIVGRVIAGIGGAGMYLGALNYISVFTSLKERPIYNALIGLCWGAGAILGPVVGGGFSDSSATWRWAFYINLPLAGILSPVYLFVFPDNNPVPTMPVLKKLTQIDWLGAALNAAAFSLFMIVLTFGGSTWAWNSPGPIALWVVFGVVLISYILQQAFSILTTPEQRLFPVELLKNRSMLLIYVATAGCSAAFSVALYFIPIFFQFTKGDSAIQAAVRLLPFIVLNIFSVMFSGAILPMVGRYMPWYPPSGALIIIGGSLMYFITSTTATATIYGYEVLVAIGTGLSFQICYTVVAAKLEESKIPGGIGFMNVAQIGTIAISLSIAGAIFQNIGFSNLQDALAAYNFSEGELRSALSGAQSVILSHSDPAVTGLAIGAIVKTISTQFIMIITGGAVTMAAGLFMSLEKLQLNTIAVG